MKITPLELRQYEFEKTFRGYNIEEVDMFISNLSQEWERVLNESKMLKMQLEIAEKEATKLREIEMTLFKTLKTAEDTSTMITEQANKQAQKNLSEANIKAEKNISEAHIEAQQIIQIANEKAQKVIQQAEQKSKHIEENILGDVQVLERDFKAMQHYKDNLLVQMRSLANATIDHVERFENKFDFNLIQNKITEASDLVGNPQVENEEDEISATQIVSEETLESSIEETIENVNLEISEIQNEDTEVLIEENVITPDEQISENELEESFANSIDEDASILETEIEEILETPKSESIEETVLETDETVVEKIEEEVEPIQEEVESQIEETVSDSILEIEVEEPFEKDVIEEKQELPAEIDEKYEETPDVTFQEETTERRTILSSSVNNYISDIDPEVQPVQLDKDDDLERIEGIGPKIAEVLNNSGITTFRELATTPAYKIRQFLEDAGPQFSFADPSTWTEQALLAAEGRWDELKIRQEELIGGKEVEENKNIEPPQAQVVENPTSNLDNITEEMLEKVNKVKDAIRKAMIDKGEKAETKLKEDSYIPTLDDVVNKAKKKSGSFFDNLD